MGLKCLCFTTHVFLSVFLWSGSKLWWADDALAQIGTVRKKDGQNMTVLRSKTTGVVQIRVYDKDGQKGNTNTPSVQRERVSGMRRDFFCTIEVLRLMVSKHLNDRFKHRNVFNFNPSSLCVNITTLE